MRRSRGWRSEGHDLDAVWLLKLPGSCSLTRAIGTWGCVTVLSFGILSCVPRHRESPVRSALPVARALPVAPSDGELYRSYLMAVADLQRLNAEMNAANKAQNFEMVREKAEEGLLRARAARLIAEQLRDVALREERLAAIDLTVEDLKRLVTITSQQ